MTLTDLMPFEDAMDDLAKRKAMPTALDTAGLRKLGKGFHRMNFVSAQNLDEEILQGFKDRVMSIINPETTQRADRVTPENPEGNVTVGYDQAKARVEMRQLFKDHGYTPNPGEAGTLKDLSSDARINLVIKTNVQVSQGAGSFIQAQDPDVLDAFPAQELYRLEEHKKDRDWPDRWQTSAAASGDDDAARILDETGRMVARKDSPIWDSLGDSSLFDDGLDNPYPPFAYNSGMWVKDVSYDAAKELGLVDINTKIEPQTLDLETIFGKAA